MKPNRSVTQSRRDFVRQSCCAAVGASGILSVLAQLRVIGAVAADSSDRGRAAAIPGDFKALVCLYLQGGNDGTNLLIPADTPSYAAYAKARGSLAIGQSSLLPIVPRKYTDGRSYALHPSVPELQSLFTQGKLSFLANVGMLVQPTTLSQYNAGKGLPPQLFAHSDQQTQWMSSVPDKPFTTGWGGRLADLVNAFNANNQISMSITLSGANLFQQSDVVTEFAVNSSGATLLTSGAVNVSTNTAAGTPGVLDSTRSAVAASMNTPQSNLMSAAFGAMTKNAINDNTYLAGVLKAAPALKTAFPGTSTAARLAMIAKMISMAPTLGLKRQIFFVQLGGFDMHGGQAVAHGPLLAELSGAMKAFYDATAELGVANQVTTFTASDFGRTYVPNADGTDHGWGNHQMIMGGAVGGGDIFGAMPSLTVGANDDTGRGRWIPSTSVDEYNATLATWFGVSAANLPVVLPNIGRFARPNLGFMG